MSTQTRYYRTDTHVINGLSAKKLGTVPDTAGPGYIYITGAAPPVYYRSDIYIRLENGSTTLLGSNVAQTTRTGGESHGYQSGTWSCPDTDLSSTTAIQIREEVVDALGEEFSNFITEQLGWTKLLSATWTFTRYTDLWYLPLHEECYWYDNWDAATRYGATDFNTRIENISYETYLDIGIRIRKGVETIKIGVCSLEATHKLRITKGGTIYGIPLLATTDPNASPVRIYDGLAVKNLILEEGVSHNCIRVGYPGYDEGACADTYDENFNTFYKAGDSTVNLSLASITSEHTWDTNYQARRALFQCEMWFGTWNWNPYTEVWLTARLFLKYDGSWNIINEYTKYYPPGGAAGNVSKLFDNKTGWNNVTGIKAFVETKCQNNYGYAVAAFVRITEIQAYGYTGTGTVKALPKIG